MTIKHGLSIGKKIWIGLLVSFGVVACGKSSNETSGATAKAEEAQQDSQAITKEGLAPSAPLMSVPVVEVKLQPLPLNFEYPATVSGFREAEIRPRVSGVLERRLYSEGAVVKAGQALYQIDPVPYQTTLAKVQAELEASKARFARAQLDFQRIEPLVKVQAASTSELDSARMNRDAAKADVALGQAKVKEARLQVQYAQVTSPISGYVSRSLKSEGTLLAGPQDLLTTVTQVDKVYVNFGMTQEAHGVLNKAVSLAQQDDDGKANNVKAKVQVEVLVDGVPIAPLAFQDARVNAETGTLDARALIDNRKGLLKPGQFVRIRVGGIALPNAVILPQRAVLENPAGGKVVMTVNRENKVEPRPVKVAQWQGADWVVTEGLYAGDKVMTDGFMKAVPGTPVNPVPSK